MGDAIFDKEGPAPNWAACVAEEEKKRKKVWRAQKYACVPRHAALKQDDCLARSGDETFGPTASHGEIFWRRYMCVCLKVRPAGFLAGGFVISPARFII